MEQCPKCGSPLTESTKFCPECGTPINQDFPPVESNNEEDNIYDEEEIDKPFYKKYLWAIIAAAVVLLMTFTCPDKEAHIEALHNKLMENIEKSSENKQETLFVASLGGGLIDKVLKAKLKVNNYLIFSTAELEDSGTTKTVSFGVLGNVFTFGIDDESLQGLKR